MLTDVSQLLRPNPAGIPEEMKRECRWMGFKAVPKTKQDGSIEFTKEPRQGAQPSRKASSTNAATWCNFETAIAAFENGQLDGLGFALGNGWAGIDTDNTVEAGELKPEARRICSLFESYAELSVSGTGVHVLVRGDVPEGKRCGNIEVYGAGRYFTVTGHVLPLGTTTVEPRQNELDDLVVELEAMRACAGEGRRGSHAARDEAWPNPPPSPPASSEEIIETGHRICPTFLALWRGEVDAYDGDESRADMALIGNLAWLCGPGQQQLVQEIALQSGLRREKWSQNRSYLRRTIDAAYRDRDHDDHYNWARRGDSQTRPRITAADTPDSSEGYLDLRRPLTVDDIGFARRLAAEAFREIRYVEKWQKFIGWDGRRWAIDDGACAVRAAQRLRDQLWREYAALPHENKTKPVLQFIESCGRANHLQNLVSLTKCQQAIRVSHELLDRDPYLLNVHNGTIDLRTGQLRAHAPADLLTQLAAVEYDPEAQAERWDLFVNQCMQGDPELVQFLQVSAGLMLCGDVSPQLLWCHYGQGSNGKSTFLGALANMLGDYAVAAPANFLMMKQGESHPTELAMLNRKRLVTAIECEGGQRMRESFIKMITGGDKVAARRMKEDFWMLDPTWHVHVSFNDPPTLNGTDAGIRRRLRVVPWRASFQGANKDTSLKGLLESEELRAGMLNWCLAGLQVYRATGMPDAVVVDEATNEYVAEQDLLRVFIDECCREGRPFQVYFDDFIAAFHKWLESRGENPRCWKAKRLSNEFKRRGFSKHRVNEVGSNRGRTIYSGLELVLRTTQA